MKEDPVVSEQLYQDIFLNAPLGIYTLDETGIITSFNPKMSELSGDDPDEVLGLNAFDLQSYKKAGLDKLFARGISGEPFETEVVYTSQLGKKQSIRHYRGVPIKNAGGPGQARLLLIVEDITERKKTEAELQSSQKVEQFERQRLLSLINNMGEAVVATDEDGKILLYNAAVLNLLDTNKSLEGEQLDKMLELRDPKGKKVNLFDLVRKKPLGISTTDYKHEFNPGDAINLYLNIAPVKLGFQELAQSGFIVILRDITREKSLEEERDEFISVVSHELRTPVAIAEGNVSNAMFMIEREKPDSIAKPALTQAHDQIVFLGNMINDLATLSRAERTDIKIEIKSVNPASLVFEMTQSYQNDAKIKQLTLTGTSAKNVQTINTSKLYLQEILQNFLVNAIKYTPKGNVMLHVRSNPKGEAIFSVSDTGIGLSKADQKRVFDKFFRSEDYRTRENSGTGLGLYVTAKLAHRLNAVIEMESELNRGSTFTVTVPSLEKRTKG